MPHSKAPFGSWTSTISAQQLAGKSIRLGMLQGDDDYIYWNECRPEEKGRCVIVRQRHDLKNKIQDCLPAPFSARSNTHEYGGGEFLVFNNSLYFINSDDQQIYRLSLERSNPSAKKPEKLTEEAGCRFTDMTISQDERLIYCIAEIHTDTSNHYDSHHPENALIKVDLKLPLLERTSFLVRGHDFYASPRLSPDGNKLAWLSWNLPDMPWESASLHVGTIDKDSHALQDLTLIAGEGDNAVFQPQWHQDGSLYFIWDKTGWNNLYQWSDENLTTTPKHVIDLPHDFGQPQWVFGMKKYAILPNGLIVLSFIKDGQTAIGQYNPENQDFTELTITDSKITDLEQVIATPNGFAGLAASPDKAQSVLAIALEDSTPDQFFPTILRQSSFLDLDKADISIAQPFAFQNSEGQEVFAFYYPPTNKNYTALDEDTAPPCIFNAHGGPTAAASQGLNLKIQYWTNRGFAWCDVDYSGSTGYGKTYRQRLNGQWGIKDVDDLTCAAQTLIEQGKVHKAQSIIRGSSAGGLTVLNALAASNTFSAGASYYGVTDLLKLQHTTHKFEAGYLFSLVGCTELNYKDILPKRSPFALSDKITAPVIFFQGKDDKVVPIEQAQSMSEALKRRNILTKLFIYEDEGHGFRKTDTIISTLHEEYAFYAQLFNFNAPLDF